MIILDTNAISEVLRSSPDAQVVAWMESVTDDVAITAITLAELTAGLRRLPAGRRKEQLTHSVERALQPYRQSSSILAFDDAAAEPYAQVLLRREHAGLPIATADAQIAAMCVAHGAVCATRNVKDFLYTGIDLVNPWEGPGITPR